jgi:hypothetical protein
VRQGRPPALALFGGSWIYPGLVLELSSLDLEEIANALDDQTDYEHQWLINPQTGEIVFWTSDTGIDGQTPIDLDDLDDLGLVGIEPLPSWVWYRAVQWLADNSLIDEEAAGRFLADHPDPDVP